MNTNVKAQNKEIATNIGIVDTMDFNKMLSPVCLKSKFYEKDYIIWGASMVQDNEGKCHLFFSRWPLELGHNAWVTHSEIAHAVSDNPLGPYKHVDVPFPARGAEYWDGLCTHAPTVHKFDGKYYIYYMGTTGDGKAMRGLNMLHRNNQRVGVAVADHPNGPWKRFDKPIIDVGEEGAWDELMTSTPTICQRPDGTYLLIYKCVAKKYKLPFGGPVVHMAATAKSPLGPFTKHDIPVFTMPNVDLEEDMQAEQLVAGGEKFPVEDPYIWVQNGSYWAILKDFRGTFTNRGPSLALFKSDDGFDWKPAKKPFVSEIEINWKNKGKQKLSRLERPQLWLKDGVPTVLFLAVFEQGNDHNYNIHISLTNNEH